MSDEKVEHVPARYEGAYEDKHWVASRIEEFLLNTADEHALYLVPRFKWLLRTWNTDRDFAYPSLEEFDPDEDWDDEEDEDDDEESES